MTIQDIYSKLKTPAAKYLIMQVHLTDQVAEHKFYDLTLAELNEVREDLCFILSENKLLNSKKMDERASFLIPILDRVVRTSFG